MALNGINVWLMSNPAGRFQNEKSVGMPRAFMLTRALCAAARNPATTMITSAAWMNSARHQGSFQILGRTSPRAGSVASVIDRAGQRIG